MRDNIMNILIVLALGGGLASLVMIAQAKRDVSESHAMANEPTPPSAQDRSDWQDRAQQMGMPRGMIMRWRMMPAMETDPYDPEAVLTYQAGLSLTPEQTTKIQAIATDARSKVKETLTKEQIDRLQPMEAGPRSMMQMHHWMMSDKHNGKFDFMTHMPMMMPSATQPTTQKGDRSFDPMFMCPMTGR